MKTERGTEKYVGGNWHSSSVDAVCLEKSIFASVFRGRGMLCKPRCLHRWLARLGITLTNFFEQVKYKCNNNQAKELCLERLNANLKGRDATLFAGCLSRDCTALLCYETSSEFDLVKKSWHLFYLLPRVILVVKAVTGSVKDISIAQIWLLQFWHLWFDASGPLTSPFRCYMCNGICVRVAPVFFMAGSCFLVEMVSL